ncbi:hypothetical protein [Magnetospirillum moscoviense]|nr:hypothetical protein [Magnetospirillum moscoviense]
MQTYDKDADYRGMTLAALDHRIIFASVYTKPALETARQYALDHGQTHRAASLTEIIMSRREG